MASFLASATSVSLVTDFLLEEVSSNLAFVFSIVVLLFAKLGALVGCSTVVFCVEAIIFLASFKTMIDEFSEILIVLRNEFAESTVISIAKTPKCSLAFIGASLFLSLSVSVSASLSASLSRPLFVFLLEL